MPLYRWGDSLTEVETTSFEGAQLRERQDLQRLLRDKPDVLEEGLFVVAEEFGNWEEVNRRIDLLALDKKGRLVVIELKRTESGELMDLQAIRYAAMVANITDELLIQTHADYISKRKGDGEVIDGEASDRIINHLAKSEGENLSIDTQQPRIILASAGFSKELTTCVLWLRDNFDMDISCIELQLYRDEHGLFLDTSQIVPLPQASDYLVKLRDRQREERQQRSEGGQRVSGDLAFRDSIDSAREGIRPLLEKLYQWAKDLEKHDLVLLDTFVGKDTTLQLRLREANARMLVTIPNSGDVCSLRLWRSGFEAFAPNSINVVEGILGRGEMKNPTALRNPPDELLDALTDAYREANGLPPTTPRPDTGPYSPAPAE